MVFFDASVIIQHHEILIKVKYFHDRLDGDQ